MSKGVKTHYTAFMMETERLKQILNQYGLKPNKALGQNFLVDAEALNAIADGAKIEGAQVLEIGPGLGALTERLLQRAARVEAVEKDARLAEILRERYPDERLTVHTMDVLQVRPEQFFDGPWHAVGNLPYYITTPIAEKMLCFLPESMTYLVQKEAADRFFAQPGDRIYGPLPALSQVFYRPERCLFVGRGSFYPQPEVDSAVVHLERREAPEGLTPAAFFGFLNRAFAMRRKTLQNNLKGTPGLFEALETLSIDPGVRAETLPPETLFRLCLLLQGK